MSVDSIAKILKVKSGAVSIALNNCGNFSERKLLYLLNELADIDYKTKSGQIASSDLAFKTFLMSI